MCIEHFPNSICYIYMYIFFLNIIWLKKKCGMVAVWSGSSRARKFQMWANWGKFGLNVVSFNQIFYHLALPLGQQLHVPWTITLLKLTLIFPLLYFQFLCVRSEFKKLKRPSVAKACRLTVQKTLYICMIIACGSRGVYYSVQVNLNFFLSWNILNSLSCHPF